MLGPQTLVSLWYVQLSSFLLKPEQLYFQKTLSCEAELKAFLKVKVHTYVVIMHQ